MTDHYIISVAKNDHEISEAKRIIQKMYGWRGYNVCESAKLSLDNPYQKTIILWKNGVIVGTTTIRIDQPGGLLIDEKYSDVVDTFRSAGKTVCEITKLAIETETQSKNATIAIYKMVYFCALMMGTDDFLIEINPRHSFFYKRSFGFKKVAHAICERVGGLPCDLLHLSINDIPFEKMWHGSEIVNDEQILLDAGSDMKLEKEVNKFRLNSHVTDYIENVANADNLHRENI